MLEISNLAKQFGTMQALDSVSIQVPPGQFVAVVGCSGAGKSTLLRLINRLVEPTSGAISFDGQNVSLLKGHQLREWRSRAAMIFQGYNLSPRLDVLTNVLVGASTSIPQARRLLRLYTKAERLRAAAVLDDLGLVEKAFERAERLSGGQQQRVAIARALMQKPKLILADEPIASLDPLNARVVMETLRRINVELGITVLCNLHSIETARMYASRAIGLRQGRLVFDGPISALTDEATSEIYGGTPAEAESDALSEAA
ncbi:phosphonate ABC transporter ATP-binding protein [Bradyrhizobium sp.]|uniref:phosphonate ABC transporter ATP-binding protein n=1 Tax=Bradyrhizobium sp. TaxID=376 RepID=UPI002735E13B|nr:phosphonate ABC transporter ATP-binding protein [Bradyrhizobium sp.]MDP3689722.1 phosphonate ABC transporter ATP-binding protein [Bradyrhizobium sp.]